ncbi:hypothetical protein [Bacteroides sp.]
MKKRNAIICLLSFVCIIQLWGQEKKSAMDILTSKGWKWQSTVKGYNEYYEFTKNECIWTICFDQKKEEGTVENRPYYLSETKDTVFNKQKVGKNNEGKYLIFLQKNHEILVFEILELNENKLYVKTRNGSCLSFVRL